MVPAAWAELEGAGTTECVVTCQPGQNPGHLDEEIRALPTAFDPDGARAG
ncbi:hypothetical protein [Phytohabitans kaempferiae]|uniref:Uncharacterized protein n=1 Tax=Phytohabitans kaempferiae TaxID=1620943 RepID=A0ABV6M294_9ACTN